MFGCYYNDRFPVATAQRGRLERTTSESSTFSREGCYKQPCNTIGSSHGNMNNDASGDHGIHHLAHAAVQERHPQAPPPSTYIVHGQFDDAPEPEDVSMKEAEGGDPSIHLELVTNEKTLRGSERSKAHLDREQHKRQQCQPYIGHSFRGGGVGVTAPEYQDPPPPPTRTPHHRYQEPLFRHHEPQWPNKHHQQGREVSPPRPPSTAKTIPTHKDDPKATIAHPATTTMTLESHRVIVERPGENDVLCGRGKGVNDHVGNQRFRRIVGQFRESYLSSSRCDKAGISRQVMEIVGGQDPPGRFLKRASTDQVQAQQGVFWYEVDQHVALEKTSQALREGSPRHMLNKKKRLSTCSAPAAPVEATQTSSRVVHHHQQQHEHCRPSCVVSP